MQKGGGEGGRREKINDDAKRCNATMNIYQWEIMVLAIRKTNFFVYCYRVTMIPKEIKYT